mmetsp:Transcript_21049/g.58563  ORF Transcript_21049/g.58563 Transcript_21049/m.58563 type:complete len:94 (-) Transcript_21049:45-326(-)
MRHPAHPGKAKARSDERMKAAPPLHDRNGQYPEGTSGWIPCAMAFTPAILVVVTFSDLAHRGNVVDPTWLEYSHHTTTKQIEARFSILRLCWN